MFSVLKPKEIGVFIVGTIVALALYHQLMMKASLAVWMTALFNMTVSTTIGYLSARRFEEKGLLVFTGMFLLIQLVGYIPAMFGSSLPIWTTGLLITFAAETLVALAGMGSILLLRAIQKSRASRPKGRDELTRGTRTSKVHKL